MGDSLGMILPKKAVEDLRLKAIKFINKAKGIVEKVKQ